MEGVAVKVVVSLPQPLEHFALNSWLLGHERLVVARPYMGLDRSGFYRTYRPELLRLLRTNRVAVATLEAEPDIYLGWACGNPGVLHYVYVKYSSRGFGLANELMGAVADEPKVYTFQPCDRHGRVRSDLSAVAARKGIALSEHRFGWRYNAAGVERITQEEREQRP